MSETPALSSELLRQVAHSTGFSLDDQRLERLRALLERMRPATERFRALDLGETEPATMFTLPRGRR